jgi:hypothetical protein
LIFFVSSLHFTHSLELKTLSILILVSPLFFVPNNTQSITQNINIGHGNENHYSEQSSLQSKGNVKEQPQNNYPTEGTLKNPYK